MKNKTIYVNGCSFAYGIGVDASEDRCIELRFSSTLAERLGVESDNRAVPGSCNRRIARRSVLDIVNTKPDLAIVIWSDPARFEIFNSDDINGSYKYRNDLDQVRPTSIYSYSRRRKHAFLDYYEYVSSRERDILYTIQDMVSVKIAADFSGIRCIQLPFKRVFHKELSRILSGNLMRDYASTLNEHIEFLNSDDLIYGINEDISFDGICGADINPEMLSKVPNDRGHPNRESHDMLSEWMYQLIQSKKLI